MKLYDQKTMDLAQAVQDVLEGKKVVKEMKYPHDMFDPKTGKKEVANNEAEHNALEKKGYTHEAPKENVGGPADLSANQNVKKVQDRHGAVKKVDLTPESVQEAHTEALAIEEARQLKDPKTEVLVVKNGKVEVINKKDLKKFMAKGYGLAEDDDQDIEEAKSLNRPQTDAEKKAAKDKFMKSADRVRKASEKERQARFARYRNEDSDKDMDEAEMSAKQAAYKKVFDAAMKKFGVKSPAELEDGKKKEFFDYVDANYEADGEVKEGVGDFFNKAKKKVQRAADKVTGADKKKSAYGAQAGATAALSKRAKPGGKSGGDQMQKLKDKIENAKEKARAADKAGDSDKEDYWNEVLYNAEAELDKLKANEGVSDFFNKAKKKVQKGVDKVAGTDLSGDKGKVDKIKQEIAELETKVKEHDDAVAKAEQLFKDKKISKEKLDDSEDYHYEIIYKAETKIDELKDKLKGMK